MKMHSVKSTALAAIGYNAERSELIAQFIDGDVYAYAKVPAGVLDKILRADSAGKEFDRLVKKPGYHYRRVQ